jgi:natural product precursor
MKKINLVAFEANEMSVQEMNKVNGGDGQTRTGFGKTSCTGSDHDNGSKDSDVVQSTLDAFQYESGKFASVFASELTSVLTPPTQASEKVIF